MPTRQAEIKKHVYGLILAGCFISAGCAISSQRGSDTEWIDLLQPEGLTSFRQPTGDWSVVGNVSKNAKDEGLLVSEPGTGTVVNGTKGRTKHLLTKMEHGDVEVHVEFMVPVKSNSGIYFQGRYEIQILDSWGVKELKHSDCGGIYQRWKPGKGYEGRSPRVNASRKPGEWQSFDIIFRAPRFDQNGKKTANAMFVKVVHNGMVIHENQELTGITRASAYKDERPIGPLMFQGNHGPVAFRNVRVKLLKD